MNEFIQDALDNDYNISDYLSDLHHDLALIMDETPVKHRGTWIPNKMSDLDNTLARQIREAIEFFSSCAHNSPAGLCSVCHTPSEQLALDIRL